MEKIAYWDMLSELLENGQIVLGDIEESMSPEEVEEFLRYYYGEEIYW